jgi:carbonic anhydrase
MIPTLSAAIARATAATAEAADPHAVRTRLGPSAALEMLKAGNARFVSGQMLQRDLRKQAAETAEGQHPYAAIVSCMDSRTSPELIFDQGIGEIFGIRIAGAVLNDDVLGSLEYAVKVAGTALIAIIGHTSCGAVKGAVDAVRLGHLTSLVAKIRPAVESLPPALGPRVSSNHPLVDRAAETSARLTAGALLESSPLLKEHAEAGALGVVAGIHDLPSGLVTFF